MRWLLRFFLLLWFVVLYVCYETQAVRSQQRIDYIKEELTPSLTYPEIDVVITWVDTSDKAWGARYEQVYQEEYQRHPQNMFRKNPPSEEVDPSIYYALHSVLQHVPWARNVILFTQRPQKPSWLDLSQPPYRDKVRLVHHDEAGLSETFNGMVTTAYVRRIPGLSEHYIQMDDDQYVLKPLSPAYFFDAQLRPVIRLNEWHVTSWRGLQHVTRGNYNFIVEETNKLLRPYMAHGKQLCRVENHTLKAFTQSLVREVEKAIPVAKWQQLGRIRCRTDFDFYSLFWPLYLIWYKREKIRIGRSHNFFIEGDNFSASDIPVDTAILCINNSCQTEVQEFLQHQLCLFPTLQPQNHNKSSVST